MLNDPRRANQVCDVLKDSTVGVGGGPTALKELIITKADRVATSACRPSMFCASVFRPQERQRRQAEATACSSTTAAVRCRQRAPVRRCTAVSPYGVTQDLALKVPKAEAQAQVQLAATLWRSSLQRPAVTSNTEVDASLSVAGLGDPVPRVAPLFSESTSNQHRPGQTSNHGLVARQCGVGLSQRLSSRDRARARG